MRAILTLALGLACAGPAMADTATGEALFADHCAVCHGGGLRGDGPMAAILTVTPPDLTRITERYGGAFPRSGIARRIDGRDPILSHGGDMPIFGAVFSARSVAVEGADGQSVLISPEAFALLSYIEAAQE